MSIGPALGHGFEIDSQAIDQVVALADGVAGRWTHGNLCADGLGTHLGRWSNVRREGSRAVGDFEFSAAARHVKPEGLSVDAPTYLMDLAESEPDMAGVSAVIDFEAVDAEPDENADEDAEPKKLARISKVLRADYVADPAANANGLFSDSPSALAEQATGALQLAEERYGKERVSAFLRAHLGVNHTEVSMTIDEIKKQHAAELAARDATQATQAASIAALTATVAEFKAAETKRQADAIDGYIASLKSDAAPNAIDETKLGMVRTLLAAGHDEAAKAFGSTLLANAKAGSKLAGTVVLLGATGNTERLKADVAYQAEQLRAAGWAVSLSADGSQITSKTPPRAVGK
jgi:hypothetical protein